MPCRALFCPAGFLADDRGAVSADWFTLSALAVGMALLAVAWLGDASRHVTGEVDAVLVYLHELEDG
ncbi:MAG: hypothetical protein JJT95_12435 [Pararhodobacter sp.]|nr:hypothetical protein [Pararhodobacter sp.]